MRNPMSNATSIKILCADCGRETTIAIDDPEFGVCVRCEGRLNSQSGKWKKKAPTVQGLGRGTVGANRKALGVG